MENERVDFSNFPVNDSPTPVNWRGRVFHVRPILGLAGVVGLVNSVVNACYDSERDVIIPEMSDFSFREHVVSMYTDAQLPEDADKCYKLLYLTDLYETVLKHASRAQIDSARRAVDMMIYRT